MRELGGAQPARKIIPNMMDKLLVGPAPLFAAETLAAIDDVGRRTR